MLRFNVRFDTDLIGRGEIVMCDEYRINRKPTHAEIERILEENLGDEKELLRKLGIVHRMKLYEEPFKKILERKKTLELRLFDDKRKKLNVNDVIIFSLENTHEEVAVRVRTLYRAMTFEDLFKIVSLKKCGFENNVTPKSAAAVMKQFYSDQQVADYGVLGIEFSLISLELARKKLEVQNGEIDIDPDQSGEKSTMLNNSWGYWGNNIQIEDISDKLRSVYRYGLDPDTFMEVKTGRKTVEYFVRPGGLNWDVNDGVIFYNIADEEQKIAVIIRSIHVFSSYREAFSCIPIEACGFDSSDIPELVVASMEKVYGTLDHDRFTCVLFSIIDLDLALRKREEQIELAYERMFPDGEK